MAFGRDLLSRIDSPVSLRFRQREARETGATGKIFAAFRWLTAVPERLTLPSFLSGTIPQSPRGERVGIPANPSDSVGHDLVGNKT